MIAQTWAPGTDCPAGVDSLDGPRAQPRGVCAVDVRAEVGGRGPSCRAVSGSHHQRAPTDRGPARTRPPRSAVPARRSLFRRSGRGRGGRIAYRQWARLPSSRGALSLRFQKGPDFRARPIRWFSAGYRSEQAATQLRECGGQSQGTRVVQCLLARICQHVYSRPDGELFHPRPERRWGPGATQRQTRVWV